MPDVVDLIEHDHREVEQLFAEFTSSKDPTVAEKICDELDEHTAAEEAVVYPVLVGEAERRQEARRRSRRRSTKKRGR